MTLAIVFLMIVGGYAYTYQSNQDQASQRSVDSITGALNRTNEQRIQAGLPPVDVPKIVGDIENGEATPSDATALNVIAKLQTDPRFRGLPGAIGAAGADGVPCLATDPACQGSPGVQGIQGDPGLTGPAGPAGPPGPAGAQGERGPQGQQGQAGPAGPEGPEGPQGPPGQNTTTPAEPTE